MRTTIVYDSVFGNTADIARAAGAHVRPVGLQGKAQVMRRLFADIDAEVYLMVDGDDTYDAASAPAFAASDVAVEVKNESEPVLCAEKDNVTIKAISPASPRGLSDERSPSASPSPRCSSRSSSPGHRKACTRPGTGAPGSVDTSACTDGAASDASITPCTPLVESKYRRVHVPVPARVSGSRVAGSGDQWGRYYDNDPRVLAGYLPASRWVPGFRSTAHDR